MKKSLQIKNSTVEFLTFVLDGKEDGVQVLYKDETIWATQKAMSILFDCSADNVGLHYSDSGQPISYVSLPSVAMSLTRSVWKTVLSLARTTLSICLLKSGKSVSVKEDSE